MSETASTKRYPPETKLVHAGALRSQFGETSEALFLTQGFIYDTAGAMRGAVQGRGSRLSLFALFQSQHLDVRAAA
jgi:O-succinylhomoserine sulfhydrylase